MSALELSKLKAGLPGITPSLGEVLFETCLVCLDNQGHKSGINMQVRGISQANIPLQWDLPVTNQMRRSWADLPEATELAATGIALLLVLELTNYTVIQRSQKGTGIDYWLGSRAEDSSLPLRDVARLEVSGILKTDNENVITTRIQQKRVQTGISTHPLPTYIVVVEFSRPLAYMVNK